MGSRVGTWISQLESCGSLAAIEDVLGRASMDRVFREVVNATYDPYALYGAFLTHARTAAALQNASLTPVDASVDASVDDAWEDLSIDLSSPVRWPGVWSKWGQTDLAPIVARILLKTFRDVTFNNINSVWGSLPLYRSGCVGSGRPRAPYMAYVIPGRRVQLLVRTQSELGPLCDLLHVDGTPLVSTAAEDIERAHEAWLDSTALTGEFADGFVLDGVLESENGDFTFCAFDVVPFSLFRSQRVTEDYRSRRRMLQALGVGELTTAPVRMLHGYMCATGDDEETSEVLAAANGHSVLAVDVRTTYPYHAETAWHWLVVG